MDIIEIYRMLSDEDSTPNEDLMKEHGLLNRLLIIYEEMVTRLSKGMGDYKILEGTAKIIHLFIEEHHEKIEETYVFPKIIRNSKNQNLKIMIDELLKQHNIGRQITEKILKITSTKSSKSADKELIDLLKKFIKMYRYHESREDTEIFPEFKRLVSKKEYIEFGEIFEKEEDKKFGKDGFDKFLNMVKSIEKKLNINDIKIVTITT